MVKQDSINQRLVFSLIDNFGWPSNEEISENASKGIFYVIQHASLDNQLKYKDLVIKAYNNKQIAVYDYAIFVDRINVRQGINQKYGTQSSIDPLGNHYLLPVENMDSVEIYRRQVWLDSLSSHVINSKITYHQFPPKNNADDAILICSFEDSTQKRKGLENVEVLLDGKVIGKSDKNGFSFINIKRPVVPTTIYFRRQGSTETQSKKIEEDKDFYEIYERI